MSKNKNFRNYQNYSNPKPVGAPVVESMIEEVEEVIESAEETLVDAAELIEEVEEAVEEVKEEPVSDLTEPYKGFVSGCAKLNIRKAPNTTADVVTVVVMGTPLLIEKSASTTDWYKVYTEAGSEGFCMKKFVDVEM